MAFRGSSGSLFHRSHPFGFLIGKLHGIDIRKVGSGNIGATNVTRFRRQNRGQALFLPRLSQGNSAGLSRRTPLPRGTGRGPRRRSRHHRRTHVPGLPRIQGRQGVSTAAGVALALAPYPLLIAFVSWVIVFSSGATFHSPASSPPSYCPVRQFFSPSATSAGRPRLPASPSDSFC